MELLIPGLILVALMVYTSTRIKKAAAQAYAQEAIESRDFVITKPDGFVSVASPEEGLEFRAYSREFGTDDTAAFRKSEATVTVIRDTSLEAAAAAIRDRAQRVVHELAGEPLAIDTEDTVGDVKVLRSYRLFARGSDILQLRVDTPAVFRDECNVAVREMLDSFRPRG